MDDVGGSGLSATVRLTVQVEANADEVRDAVNAAGESAAAGPDAQARALADGVLARILDAPGVVAAEVDGVEWEGGADDA